MEYIRKRVGKDLRVTWPLTVNKGTVPLFNCDLRLEIVTPNGTMIFPPFVIREDGKAVMFDMLGTEYTEPGCYTFVMWRNFGKIGQTVVDKVHALTLVRHSCEEGVPPGCKLSIDSIEIEQGNLEVGAPGEKGDKGDPGEKGDKGDPGEKGEKGEKGDPGEKGEKGDTGEKGEKGDTGATGQQGPQGEKGDTGETGPQGPKGDTGETGPQGAIGPKGDPLTWEDLTEEQKESLRGPKGEPGDPAMVTKENVEKALGYVPGDDDNLVHKTGDEAIEGAKTFDTIRAMEISLGEASLGVSLTPALDFSGGTGVSIGNEPSILTNVRDPKLRYDAANKKYVDEEVGKKYAKPADGIPESDLSEEVKTKLNSGGGPSINVVDNLTSDSATDALSAQQGKALKSLADAKTGFTDIGTFTVGESYAGSLGVAILANHTPKAGDAFIGTDNEDGFRHTALVIRNDDVLFNFLYSSAEDNFMQFVSIMRQTGAVMAEYKMVADSEIERWNGKQDEIADLAIIRSGAEKGATALQSFTEDDPTVPSWAKQPNKPTYTASEVGALPSSTKIPSKVSDLDNDSKFIDGITKAMVEDVLTGDISTHTHSQYLTSNSLDGYATESYVDTKIGDIESALASLHTLLASI